jgi:hypothetical protein
VAQLGGEAASHAGAGLNGKEPNGSVTTSTFPAPAPSCPLLRFVQPGSVSEAPERLTPPVGPPPWAERHAHVREAQAAGLKASTPPHGVTEHLGMDHPQMPTAQGSRRPARVFVIPPPKAVPRNP